MIAALSLFLLLTDVVRADHADHAYHHAEFFTRETMPLARSDMTATVVGDDIYTSSEDAPLDKAMCRELCTPILPDKPT